MSANSGANGALWARLAERFPAAAIPQACLSATIEFRGQQDVNHRLGESDARNLFRFLVRRGVIAGRAGRLPRLKAQATPIAGMDVGYCPKPGFLAFHVREGERVRKGQAVCDVIDPADPRGPRARTPMLSRTNGILFSRRPDGRLISYQIARRYYQASSGIDDGLRAFIGEIKTNRDAYVKEVERLANEVLKPAAEREFGPPPPPIRSAS